MRAALIWFAAAIVVALVALFLGAPLNGGAGFVLVLLWLVGSWRLATTRAPGEER